MNGKYLIKTGGTSGLRIVNLQNQLEQLFKHGYVLTSSFRMKLWTSVIRDYWSSTLLSVKYLVIGADSDCKMVISFYFDDPIRERDFIQAKDYEIVTVEEMLKKEGKIKC